MVPDPDAVSGPDPDALSGPDPDALSGPDPDAVSGPDSDAVSGSNPDAVSGPDLDALNAVFPRCLFTSFFWGSFLRGFYVFLTLVHEVYSERVRQQNLARNFVPKMQRAAFFTVWVRA